MRSITIQRGLLAFALTGFFAVGVSAQNAPAPQQPDAQSDQTPVQNGQTNSPNLPTNIKHNRATTANARKAVHADRTQLLAAKNQLAADESSYGHHSPQVKQDRANLKALHSTLQADRGELLHDKTGQ